MPARASGPWCLCAATAALLFLAPRPAHAQTAEFTSLRLMRDKGIITQAEYDSAIADLQTTNGARAEDSTSLVVGKWSTTLYGFLEGDYIYDTTQSFNDLAGNAQVARPNGSPPNPPGGNPSTYAGDNGRTTFSVRNSRLGLRFRAPEYHRVNVNGILETDFLGTGPTITTGSGEQTTFTSPVLRIRHAAARVETPYVDVLVGQYWDLFGWQGVYAPNTVEIQGVPSELYSRDIQLRLTNKSLRNDAVSLEIALAAVRPPSRNSVTPDLQGGLRFAINHWTGVSTAGATGTAVMPASIAVTGDMRHFKVPELSQDPTDSVALDSYSVAVDAFIPVIPAKSEKEGNALSLTGEFVYGNGISNLYTGLTGGITMPTIPNTLTESSAGYPQDIDNGMVVFDTSGNLHAIQWTTFLVGAQYYFPRVNGRLWLSGNFSRQVSNNIANFTNTPGVAANPSSKDPTPAEAVRKSLDWFDVNLFAQVTPAFRAGVEYANFHDVYVDNINAINHRVQASGFLIF